MSDLVQLTSEISNRLPDELNLVCETAPAGTNADGQSYRDRCNECHSKENKDEVRHCIAEVVASFVQENQSGAPPVPAPKNDTSLNSCAPGDVNCELQYS